MLTGRSGYGGSGGEITVLVDELTVCGGALVPRGAAVASESYFQPCEPLFFHNTHVLVVSPPLIYTKFPSRVPQEDMIHRYITLCPSTSPRE
jgi:hypothetical protein